mmetsp:Transcript_25363/g.62424  ORF Transcript_25363/g.62424 Transcript_25363/m.62424 type:complete len:92 (-) Transcript_25363:100-375(-)
MNEQTNNSTLMIMIVILEGVSRRVQWWIALAVRRYNFFAGSTIAVLPVFAAEWKNESKNDTVAIIESSLVKRIQKEVSRCASLQKLWYRYP